MMLKVIKFGVYDVIEDELEPVCVDCNLKFQPGDKALSLNTEAYQREYLCKSCSRDLLSGLLDELNRESRQPAKIGR